jgi:LmbE family N-acetylglucosaminyl deacetylase
MSGSPTIVFFHAHPDDEAIFTGGTMAMLVERGIQVVVVVATSGELGIPEPGDASLGSMRRDETLRSCRALGVNEVIFLEWSDSGLHGENPNGFCHAPAHDVARGLCEAVAHFGSIDALVSYDDHGIYGHPDHVQIHHAGRHAARALGVTTHYEATVDREYLHFVETHVVVEAGLGDRPVGRGLAATDLGMPTLLVDVAIDVRSRLDDKRKAMAAHASQLPADAPAFALGELNFGAVYGYEWYTRRGPAGLLEELLLA